MTTPLYPKKSQQWLKADESLEKWKPKEAGQMSFVVFQLKAQTCMCLQHATFVVLVRFVCQVLTRQCLLLPLPMLPYSCLHSFLHSGVLVRLGRAEGQEAEDAAASLGRGQELLLDHRAAAPLQRAEGREEAGPAQVCDCRSKAVEWFKYKRVCQCVASVPLVSGWPVLCFPRSWRVVSLPPSALLGSFCALSTFCAFWILASTAASRCTSCVICVLYILFSCRRMGFGPGLRFRL